jgi:hypothetical protein
MRRELVGVGFELRRAGVVACAAVPTQLWRHEADSFRIVCAICHFRFVVVG